VTVPIDGLFEPIARLGDTVEQGHLVGLVHRLDDLDAVPVELLSSVAGVVAIARMRPLVRADSHAYSISAPVPRAQVADLQRSTSGPRTTMLAGP
jgi:hypothetical protein